MNVQRLLTIAEAVIDDLHRTNILGRLEKLSVDLSNLVSSPNDPSYQTNVAGAREDLRKALRNSGIAQFPAAWQEVLSQVGIAPIVNGGLEEQIDEAFSDNAMTPAVIHNEVERLRDEVTKLRSTLTSLISNLDSLQIPRETLEPGECEFAVLIPRFAVEDELERLGAEFIDIQKLLNPFSELVTGSRDRLKVREISSTDFGLYVALFPTVAACLAKTIDWLLESYKKLLEIRVLRHKLMEQGLSEKELTGVDKHANEHMERAIGELTDWLMKEYSGLTKDRSNEVRAELRVTINKIANRIDLGYNLDVRCAPLAADEGTPVVTEDVASALEEVSEISPRLKYMNLSGERILSLPEAVVSPPTKPKRRRTRKTQTEPGASS